MNNNPQTYLTQLGAVVVFEESDVWILLDNRWMQLAGRFAEAFKSVFQNGKDASALAPLEQTGWPYTDKLIEIARSSVKEQISFASAPQSRSLLFVELTEQCNLRCIHCYAGSEPSQSEFLDMDTARDVVQEAKQLGYQAIQFTGGEPLLHPGLIELVNLAASCNIPSVEIFTNGNLLTPEFLQSIPPSTSFALSFYSHNLGVHDQITQEPGSGAATLRAIDLLLERNFSVRVGTILMDENRQSYPQTKEFLLERGISPDKLRANEVAAVGRGSNAWVDTLDSETPFCADDSEGPIIEAGVSEQYNWTGKACVSASGDVYPCIFARWLKLGSLKDSSLGEILTRTQLSHASELTVPECWDYVSRRLSCNDCRMLAFALMRPASPC